MILDGHIHLLGRPEGSPADFLARIHGVGIDGGVVISPPPASYRLDDAVRTDAQRLEETFRWTAGDDRLYPFYWIDPLADDALDQVARATARGVAGFKIICDRFYPYDERNLAVCRAAAAAGRPILFHSGILWNGRDSARFNRPGNFEALIEIEGLRFALAHIAWPWCDELIAVYGKFLNARHSRRELSVEMFIDLTPGTPVIYRREALTKLFTVGYDVGRNVFFGSDCRANDYNAAWPPQWITRDNAIYDELGLDAATRDGIYGRNLLRFVGVDETPVRHDVPRPGE